MRTKAPTAVEALGLLCLVAFLNYFDRNLLYPLLPLIARDFHLSETAQGQLASGFHVVYALTALGVGPIAERLSRKRVLLSALLFWSSVTLLSGTASSFVLLLVWRSLTGLGEGVYFPLASSVIGDLFAQKRRARAFAIHGACVTLGGACGMAAAGFLGPRVGWRETFFLAIVPGVLLALLIWKRFGDSDNRSGAQAETQAQVASDGSTARNEASTHGDASAFRRPYLQIVGQPRVLWLSLAAGAAGWATQSMTTFFVSFLHRVHGLNLARAGVMGGLGFGATVIGQLWGGRTSDGLVERRPQLRPLLVAIPYLIATVALSVLGESGSGVVALSAFGLVHVARGFAEPSIYGSIVDVLGASERATGAGFLLFWTFVGASVGPIVTGAIIDAKGHGPAFWQLAGASLLAGVAGLAAARAGRGVADA